MLRYRVAMWFVIGLLAAVVTMILVTTNRRSRVERVDTGGGGYVYGGLSATAPSLAELVANASAIVVASYDSISELRTETITSPEPTPTGASASVFTPGPQVVAHVIGTSLVVDSIIKNDGNLVTSQEIVYETFGKIPVTQSEIDYDVIAKMPVVWPEDTEFILFLEELPGESGNYYVPWSEYGRVLTDGDVTCSDGARTVADFMVGMSKQEFIEAVEDEMNSPSPTETDFPTETPTATPNPLGTP